MRRFLSYEGKRLRFSTRASDLRAEPALETTRPIRYVRAIPSTYNV